MDMPEEYLAVPKDGYLAIHQRKFSGPGPRIAKVVWTGAKWELRAFKGHEIAKVAQAALQPWVDQLPDL